MYVELLAGFAFGSAAGGTLGLWWAMRPRMSEEETPDIETVPEESINGWGWACLDCTSRSKAKPRPKDEAAELALRHPVPSRGCGDHRVVLVPARYLEAAHERGDNEAIRDETSRAYRRSVPSKDDGGGAETEEEGRVKRLDLSKKPDAPDWLPPLTPRQAVIVASMLKLGPPGAHLQTGDIAQTAEDAYGYDHDKARADVSRLAKEGVTRELIHDAGYGQWKLATEEEYQSAKATS